MFLVIVVLFEVKVEEGSFLISTQANFLVKVDYFLKINAPCKNKNQATFLITLSKIR